MIPDSDSKLRKIERELYTTDIVPPKRRENLHAPVYDAPEDWTGPKSQKANGSFMASNQSSSLFKKIFIGSLGFLVVAGIILGISFLAGGNAISSKNVDIVITAKSLADGGENFPADVTITNRNKVQMQQATLTLSYPNTGSTDPNAVTRVTRDIGTVDVGASHDESFPVQLYGTQGSVQPITADVQFNVPGSNAVYDATNSFSSIHASKAGEPVQGKAVHGASNGNSSGKRSAQDHAAEFNNTRSPKQMKTAEDGTYAFV